MRFGRDAVVDRLADDRSLRVAFVAHCLLNENVRFMGGAACPGAVRAAVQAYVRSGVGIVQLPCPEQRAWGGVLKRWMLACYGRRILLWRPARRLFVAFVRWVSAREYQRLACRTANEITDYLRSGFEVVEVVGVGPSPSCGVVTSVDLDAAIAAMARCDRGDLSPATVRERVVTANIVRGQGMFMARLQGRLADRGVSVPFREHDLLEEWRAGRPRARGGEIDARPSPC